MDRPAQVAQHQILHLWNLAPSSFQILLYTLLQSLRQMQDVYNQYLEDGSVNLMLFIITPTPRALSSSLF